MHFDGLGARTNYHQSLQTTILAYLSQSFWSVIAWLSILTCVIAGRTKVSAWWRYQKERFFFMLTQSPSNLGNALRSAE